ncbi:hypothetical protein F7725_024336 [Dissostichus mawsoni]|uniref:Condensin complex subunit 1 C-terminal domain-containing protein n=1 Tax=Dissostichus mawsoni TaxID=36200 RepID=A0A7J5XZ09_DISMA|nr:hypothetical protein F7725_024336 [Dissostichus mawsoni]
MEDSIEDELAVSGNNSFKSLYQCLLVHAADQQQSADGDGASQVKLILHLLYTDRRITEKEIQAYLGDPGENKVSIKSLVAVLSFFVLGGKDKTANIQQRVSSLHAASIYLLLLGIPGSIANKVFHEVLLDTCSDLTSHCWPQDSGKKRKKDGLKSSQAEGKRSKPQRKDNAEMDVDEADEEEEEEELHFSGKDLMKIREAVVQLVQSLLRLLQTFPLKDRPQSAGSFTQIFSKLLSFEPIVGRSTFSAEQDINKLKSVPEMAFYGLQLLCSPTHGEQKESLRRVFHQLLYVILMMKKGYRGKPTPLVPSPAVLSTRHQAIHFICHLVEELKELALPFLQILLQHICFQMVEKSEIRSHGAQAVGMLTSQMTSADYACFIKWLFYFSRKAKVASRLFSIDVVMVLLDQPERKAEECQDPELQCLLPHRFLIQSLLFARRTDDSPTVKGHALASLAQCLELPSPNVTRAVHNLFSATGAQTVLEGEITEGSSQATQKTFCTLPFRTVEFSSTEPSDCEARENLALLLRRVKDSKVNVRKSALQALLGLLKHNVVPMIWENLEKLSECCRDPAVSVKKKALSCVGELLAAKPECSVVQKAWLQGVLPAVMDAESSVQEKALEAWTSGALLNQSVLCRPSPGCGSEADLGPADPALRYFSRAFGIWSKQNMVTQTFITNLISHTEAEHASGAWLLLSKVIASASRLPYEKILDAWDTMISSNDVPVTTSCHILYDLMSWLKTFSLPLEVICAAAFLNQHCGELVGKRTVLLVESVLTTRSEKLPGCQEELPASLPRSQFKANSMPTKVRAHGVITLGQPSPLSSCVSFSKVKCCSQPGHEDLIHKYLPVFAREMEEGKEVAVRNNVVVIMCDLCVRYTNMVDHYIPNISACLGDNEAIIREQTLIMLTNLLQDEIVKWKGSLFFRFMVVLVDPVPAIASLCEYCLLHLLLKKNPEMFSQHFIECIFHFNSYDNHKSYNKFPQSERERLRFSLKGARNREKRFRIYRFLLEHFTDAQRFNITIKINQTVLACFADNELPLDADGGEILSETFRILSLKEMKLQAMSHPAGGAAAEEVEEENMATMAQAVMQAAQKKVVSQVQKKIFIENMVPVIISLKSLLEQKRSPVLRDLMAYLQVTMQDYRNEVKEFFSGDEQLAAELEFALKTKGKEREMEEQMDQCTVSPGLCSQVPGPPPVYLCYTAAPASKPPSARLTHIDRRVCRSGSMALEGTVMPKGAVDNRAISTPKGDDIDFTFDEEVSAIFSDNITSVIAESSVLDVRSNKQKAPGLRQWNVQSPLRQKKKGSIFLRFPPGPGGLHRLPDLQQLIQSRASETFIPPPHPPPSSPTPALLKRLLLEKSSKEHQSQQALQQHI